MKKIQSIAGFVRTVALKIELAYHQAFAFWSTHNGNVTRAHRPQATGKSEPARPAPLNNVVHSPHKPRQADAAAARSSG